MSGPTQQASQSACPLGASHKDQVRWYANRQMQGYSKCCLLEVTICNSSMVPSMGRVESTSLIAGTFLTQKAHSPREKGALGISGATAASLDLSKLLSWRAWPGSPEWSCHKAMGTSGNTLAFSLTLYAQPVTLSRHFRLFPTFLGIFSLKGLEGSPILLLLTHAFFVLQQLH
jgi:hypothetical protein